MPFKTFRVGLLKDSYRTEADYFRGPLFYKPVTGRGLLAQQNEAALSAGSLGWCILKIGLCPSLLNTAQCPIIGNGNVGPGLVFHFFVDTLYVTYSVLSSIELYPAPPNIQKVPLGKTTEAAYARPLFNCNRYIYMNTSLQYSCNGQIN